MQRPAGARAPEISDRRSGDRSAGRKRSLAFVLAWSILLGTLASIAAAAPPTPSFGPTIDRYAAYEGQTRCDPSAKPGVVDFRDLFLATYPQTGDSGIIRACNIGGQSEHKEGRAWDWRANVNNAEQTAAVNDALNWLLATDQWGNRHARARRFGIQYIIWNHRVWKAYPSDGQPSGTWHPYGGANPHTDHVHFSFSWAGAQKETTWWNPGRTNPPPPPGDADGSALVVDSVGDMWFAAVKADGNLYSRRFDVSAGVWNNFTHHGGGWSPDAAPALAAQSDGVMRLFAVKDNGQMHSRKWTADVGWSGFSTQGGSDWSNDAGPVAVTRPSGEITLAAVKESGKLFTRTYRPSSNTWTGFAEHGDGGWSAKASPALIAGTDGRLWLFAVKATGHMFHRSFTAASGWSNFQQDGPADWSTAAGPVGTARANGAITWAGVKARGSIYTRSYTNSTWSGFALHGDANTWSPFASPSITAGTDGRLWLFAVKQSGVLYHHSFQTGTGWDSFHEDAHGWSPRVSPVAAARPNGHLTWTTTKDDGVLYTRSYTGTWSGYHPHSTGWAN